MCSHVNLCNTERYRLSAIIVQQRTIIEKLVHLPIFFSVRNPEKNMSSLSEKNKKHWKCGFCRYGEEKEDVCGRLYKEEGGIAAHLRCMVGHCLGQSEMVGCGISSSLPG